MVKKNGKQYQRMRKKRNRLDTERKICYNNKAFNCRGNAADSCKKLKNVLIGVWRSWGRFRAPPEAEEARKKEWQQLGD